MDLDRSQTYATRLTPGTTAAIATIAVFGMQALRLVGLYFSGKRTLDAMHIDDVRYGTWTTKVASHPAEQIVVCRTSENEVEIHCHGGTAVCQRILDDLQRAGCQLIASHEWPCVSRDEFQSQAELDLQLASTEKVASILLDQFRGALSFELQSILELLDDSNVDNAKRRIRQLIDAGQSLGSRCRSQRVCLVGPPNAGKSSLLNAIVGTQRAIVHHQPGTTRDAIESQVALDGWPVTIIDTAGIRSVDDPIELAGMAMARRQLASADLIVVVVDACVGLDAQTRLIASESPGPTIVAWNKCDISTEAPPTLPFPVVSTSAVSQDGIEPLLAAIVEQLFATPHSPGAPVPFRPAHIERLRAVWSQLEKSDHRSAAGTLRDWLNARS